MTKLLLALLLVVSAGWGVRIISQDEAVIVNNLDFTITCYIHYDDGDFEKRRVRAYTESRPFSRWGLVEVECY